MSLYDELSLSKNGGVYFEGTRVTPTDDPVLFVGLGGTGVDAVLRIKNEVQTRMPLPKNSDGKIIAKSPANIAFMAIDTDVSVQKKTFGVAGFDRNGDELINISVDGLPKVIHDIVEKHLNDREWTWYDKELTANGGLDGANGVRQIGRFMLFHNINNVCARFTAVLQRILTAAKGNSLKIFVLTGIGGGTGSGTFLDVAYILRKIGGDLTPNVQLHGFIFTPDLNKRNGGDETSLYRNGFASLKELDYWMSASEHEQLFEQCYNNNFVVKSHDRPFDYCHIITAKDASHNIVSYSDAMDAVGSDLFSYIVSEQVSTDGNTALNEMYDNIAGHIVIAQKPYPANYNYLSVGSAKIEIPYTEITTLVAARVFSKLEPMFNSAPNHDTFNGDLFRMEMNNEQMWSYIHRDVISSPLTGKKYGYSDVWPGNGPYNAAHQWLNGHAEQVIRKNRSNLASYYEGKFREYISALMKSPDRGPCYVARMIKSNTSDCLVRTLEGFKTDCLERKTTCQTLAPGLKNRMEQSFFAGQNAGIFARSNATKEYIDALTRWVDNEYAYWAYSDLADGVQNLIDRLNKYYDRVFKNLQDALCELPEIFRKNVDQIKVNEQDLQKHPELAKKYLVRPLEFEKKYAGALADKVDEATKTFNESISENLKKWVGVELDDIDTDIIDNTDISGTIASFIAEHFRETLNMNMEALLLDKLGNGENAQDYLRAHLDDLKKSAIPLYDMDVIYSSLDIKAFSLISIPDDCPQLNLVAGRSDRPKEDRPKKSSERSKLQWVKVIAGMPLFAFPEVAKMEQKYEMAMKTSRETRKGVHLRWEWREQLPSPLPETTWSNSVRNEPEKEYSKNYNEKIRAAFDKCCAAGIIRISDNQEHATLFVADAGKLDGIELHGSILEKKEKLERLKQNLWGDSAARIQLNPFGDVSKGEPLARIRENVLRFYNISSEIENQAKLLEKFDAMSSSFVNVERFIDSIFADLIFDQGFNRKFRKSEYDISPIVLFDKMSQSAYPDYETYKAFAKELTEDIKNNISEQLDRAKRNLIAADGNFNADAVSEKAGALGAARQRFEEGLKYAQEKADRTPIEERGSLIDIIEFYQKAIELVDNYLRMMK